MADKKINGSLEITGKLNPNASGYGFNLPSSASLTADEGIATEDYVDNALSKREIGLNGKTYKASGTTIELPDLAEVKEIIGTYPEYIEATVANGMAGKIGWEDLQLAIDDGSINFANHTFDTYLYFYFPKLLEKYGLYSFKNEGEPIVPAYVSLYPTEPPMTMPDTVVDFPTLKAWICENIGTLVGLCYVDEEILGSDVSSYNLENGMDSLNIAFKNDDIVCEARLQCSSGLGKPIVGATNPPTVPGIESTFVGEFRGDAYGGKINCDSLEAQTIKTTKIGDENYTVGSINVYRIGGIGQIVDKIYVNNIGDANHKAIAVYADNIGSANAKVNYVYAFNVGNSNKPVGNIYATNIDTSYIYSSNIGNSIKPVVSIYATNIGSKNKQVSNIYASNIGSADSFVSAIYTSHLADNSNPVDDVYCLNLGSSNCPVENVYATNVVLKNLPTTDPGVEGALWNDGGTLKISAGQQQA